MEQQKIGLDVKSSPSINPVIPRIPKRARFDAHRLRTTSVKPTENIKMHDQPFDSPPFAPGMNDQPPCAEDDSRHVVAAIHSCGVIGCVLFCVQRSVRK